MTQHDHDSKSRRETIPSPPRAFKLELSGKKADWQMIVGIVAGVATTCFGVGVAWAAYEAGQSELQATTALAKAHDKAIDAIQPAIVRLDSRTRELSADLDRAANEQQYIRARIDVLIDLAARESPRQMQTSARSVAARGDNPRAGRALGDLMEVTEP